MAQKDLVVKMTINSKDFEKGLQNAKSSMDKHKMQVNDMSSNFSGAMNSMTKAFVAFRAVIGAAGIFKTFIESTESGKDAFNNIVGGMKDAWSSFLYQLNTGNFSGLDNLIDKAINAKIALDSLGDLVALEQFKGGKDKTELTELLNQIQKKKKSGEDYSSEITQYQTILSRMRKDSQETEAKAVESLRLIFGKHGIDPSDYGFGPSTNIESFRALEILARESAGGLHDQEMNTYREVRRQIRKDNQNSVASNVDKLIKGFKNDEIYTGKTVEDVLGVGYTRKAKLYSDLADITEDQKKLIEGIINQVDNTRTTIESYDKALNRYLQAGGDENGGKPLNGGKGSNAPAPVTMTEDQIIEYWNRAVQNEILAADREKDAMIIDIELEDEDIVEPELDALIERVKQLNTEWQNHVQNMVLYSDAIGQFSNMFAELTKLAADGSPWQRFGAAIGGVLGEISKLMSTYASLIAIESVAESIKAGNGIPFPYNLIAIAAAGTALLGIISSLKGSFKDAGSFATGGIVGGNSYTGDKLFARVNSGEMILNRAQQAALFGNTGGNVHFIIEGSQLRGVLDNYDKTSNL